MIFKFINEVKNELNYVNHKIYNYDKETIKKHKDNRNEEEKFFLNEHDCHQGVEDSCLTCDKL